MLHDLENAQTMKRPLSRALRQRQGLIKRFAFVAVALLIFCVFFLSRVHPNLTTVINHVVEQNNIDPWSILPTAPPTPFTLKGLLSPSNAVGTLSDEQAPVALLTAPRHRPECATINSLDARYRPLAVSNTTIYLALNLFNSQNVLPTFLHELPVLLSFLGPHRFHVEIYENGSEDKTPELLLVLARIFASMNVTYNIVVQGERVKSDKENGRRIIELANLRNAVMNSLYTGQAAKDMNIDHFDYVLFMNDIIWCASDMLEILYEHVLQDAHMTCATDWGSNVVYDRWVARTMSGLPFYNQDDLLDFFNGPKAWQPPYPRPLPFDENDRAQFHALKPIQVFSCWTGAAVIDARAFFPSDSLPGPQLYLPDADSDSLTIPTSTSAIRFRTATNDHTRITDKESECFLICVDLWRRGMGRILLVPRASVAYDLDQYSTVRQNGLRTAAHPIGIDPPADGPNKEKIRWKSEPPANVIYHDHAWWHEKERWGAWDEA